MHLPTFPNIETQPGIFPQNKTQPPYFPTDAEIANSTAFPAKGVEFAEFSVRAIGFSRIACPRVRGFVWSPGAKLETLPPPSFKLPSSATGSFLRAPQNISTHHLLCGASSLLQPRFLLSLLSINSSVRGRAVLGLRYIRPTSLCLSRTGLPSFWQRLSPSLHTQLWPRVVRPSFSPYLTYLVPPPNFRAGGLWSLSDPFTLRRTSCLSVPLLPSSPASWSLCQLDLVFPITFEVVKHHFP